MKVQIGIKPEDTVRVADSLNRLLADEMKSLPGC